MTGSVQDSPRELERKLAERTRELADALAGQAATSEILRVISSCPNDLQPVFDCILENATRLCGAHLATLGLYDGEKFKYVAQRGGNPDFIRDLFSAPFVPREGSNLRRVLDDRCPVHTPDRLTQHIPAGSTGFFLKHGARTMLAVPMIKDGTPVGAIVVYRPEVKLFTQKQIDLLTTFASQAVIAIENVRLFEELQARNAKITEALEQQTATSEILRVISSSPTDLQPVFEAILENATRLCGAHLGTLGLFDGEKFEHVAQRGGNAEFIERMFRGPFVPIEGTNIWRMLFERHPIHVLDLVNNRQVHSPNPLLLSSGVRSLIAVPMLKDGRAVGGITVYRHEVRAFTQEQIELVSIFANQAVIAIENVRLFHEIRQKSAELEVANRHKSEFLAGMSHELRTPLNAILGFSEVLAERMFGDINEKQAEYLGDIRSSGTHLLSLINDILDLSKIEAGRMDLDVGEFDVAEALANALTLVRERATRHGVRLELRCDSRIGPWAADERKFKQIMLNLLSNAVKFTPSGGTITVEARRDAGALDIAVSDTGCGISAEDQALVFDEFRQVGGDTGKKAEGTGLGLALTRRFVELHGGSIGVQSALGKGTTFRFSLPARAQ